MKNGDKPAFQQTIINDGHSSIDSQYAGLTKREYFSVKMLSAVMIGYDLMTDERKKETIEYLQTQYGKNITVGEGLTKNAIAFADELLTQLSETSK